MANQALAAYFIRSEHPRDAESFLRAADASKSLDGLDSPLHLAVGQRPRSIEELQRSSGERRFQSATTRLAAIEFAAGRKRTVTS
jgi:hypothetical protein